MHGAHEVRDTIEQHGGNHTNHADPPTEPRLQPARHSAQACRCEGAARKIHSGLV